MRIPEEHRGRFFYHFTHIDNLNSIIQNGLLSTNTKKEYKIKHFDVANESIQHRRSEMRVTVGPRGTVHDYVPFYFASRSMMLLSLINNKIVDQREIVFISISVQKILHEDVIFTDASANTNLPPNFYENPKDLCKLNWELIDSQKWGRGTNEELHARMAEVLIYQEVPVDWIDSFIVFDEEIENRIKTCFIDNKMDAPPIFHRYFNGKNFYFTKFMFDGRKEETLVTGPKELLERYNQLVKNIIDERPTKGYRRGRFADIKDALEQIREEFCVLPELEGIYGLDTDNSVHKQTVSDHTLSVVMNVENNKYFEKLGERSKNIVRLAAYLHDMGKGPKCKWKEGIQKAYGDHPRDAIPMLDRILTWEFYDISAKEIKRLCLLVVYHDLLGDIIYKGRRISELENLYLNEKELTMLAALSKADIESISLEWSFDLDKKIDSLVSKV